MKDFQIPITLGNGRRSNIWIQEQNSTSIEKAHNVTVTTLIHGCDAWTCVDFSWEFYRLTGIKLPSVHDGYCGPLKYYELAVRLYKQTLYKICFNKELTDFISLPKDCVEYVELVDLCLEIKASKQKNAAFWEKALGTFTHALYPEPHKNN
jgi:hypothetical protein